MTKYLCWENFVNLTNKKETFRKTDEGEYFNNSASFPVKNFNLVLPKFEAVPYTAGWVSFKS
jgi:hypothetical protein